VMAVVGHVVGGLVTAKVKKSHTVEVAREELSGGIQFKTVVGDDGGRTGLGASPAAGTANRATSKANCVKATDN
jgi:hypothetical protein